MNESIQEETKPPITLNDISEGFQYETKVDIPGSEGSTHVVTLALLWESEVRAIHREVSRKIESGNYISYQLEIRFETLVRAITQVDDWSCFDSNDQERNAFLKKHLRSMLGKAERLLDYLYNEYQRLQTQRNKEWGECVLELKKPSGTLDAPDSTTFPSAETTMDSEESIQTDLENGEDGGS